MRVKVLAAALLLSMLSGCAKSEDPSRGKASPQTTRGADTVIAPTPDVRASAGLGAVRGSSKADLIIGLVGNCVAKRSGQQLLIEVELSVGWIGTTFPATWYEVAGDRGGKPVRGQVTSTDPFKAAVGGESSSYLGRDVMLTLTIDPDNAVSEFSESNNVTKVVATVAGNVANGDVVPCA